MKKIILSSFILVFLIVACNSSKKTENQNSNTNAETSEVIADSHNAQNSLDYYGIYEGITPCADCEGIKVTVTLNKDTTFALQNVYLKGGEEILPTEFTGKFTWNDNGSIITLNGVKEAPSLFFVTEGKIIIVDEKGNKIDTELEEYYILKQIKVFQ